MIVDNLTLSPEFLEGRSGIFFRQRQVFLEQEDIPVLVSHYGDFGSDQGTGNSKTMILVEHRPRGQQSV